MSEGVSVRFEREALERTRARLVALNAERFRLLFADERSSFVSGQVLYVAGGPVG